ncbi:M20 peptidase aminoacylase family protein [Chungangia koreensis]|uniref:M20 peptidase aminoacylase family protein n=1 Tax=Chungangia koreensis TaxID=752657 RepID=A0ABV8X7Z3_9LACT
MTTNLKEQVLTTFHHLHDHAEISWEEVETTHYIKQLLLDAGCQVSTFEDCTGVIGEYGNFQNDLPVVGIRADIDALWQEVDGEFKANHSCGHDAHMSIVLGVLWKLNQDPLLKDRVALKFIFQPAEEKGEGAITLAEKGVVDDVDFLFGIHLRPAQETPAGKASPVIIHGASSSLTAEIKGDDAHGARPHLGHNAIEIAAQIVNMIGTIHLNPMYPHSVKMTSLQAGGKSANIIPGNATFSLDLRAQTNELMEQLKEKVHLILDTVRNLYDTEIEVLSEGGIVAAITNDEAMDIMRKAIVNTLGEDGLAEPLITPGGDDFHYYKIHKPELKATMLGLGCGLLPGLHHPHMTFNREAMMDGVDILFNAILETYK